MQKETNLEGVLPEYKLTKVQRFWLKHHQACQASGKSQADYAREHGLAIKSLYYWKKRLLQIGAIDAGLSSTPPIFQKVHIAPVADAGIHCQIQFANGLGCELTGLDASGQEQLLLTASRLPQ